jgi:excisionase family DNA binding protein
MHNQSALLTVREMAERLRISLATAYQLVKQGAIASLRVGCNRGAIRIRESDLMAYENSMTQQVDISTIETRNFVRVDLKHIKLR